MTEYQARLICLAYWRLKMFKLLDKDVGITFQWVSDVFEGRN
jgi:hypothetical protein